MKIYEPITEAGDNIIILKKKEGKQLLEALKAAYEVNKRKKIWKRLIKQLENELPLY